MPKKKLMLIGGGGHCRSVLDSILESGLYEEICIIDSSSKSILGIRVLGTDDDIPYLIDKGWTDAFVTVGSIGETKTRRKLYEMAKRLGLHIPIIIDPSAVVARDVCISEGTFVGKRAVINSGSNIGVCSIINTGAIIEHDCKIDDFVHVSPGSVICGQVTIGKDTHIGAGSVVKQQLDIGNNVLIGSGSVVVKNIMSGVTAYGNPCRVVNK